MQKMNRLTAGAAALAVALAAALPAPPAIAAEALPGLKLPDDLKARESADAAQTRGIQYREHHIGGRLERVTVTRDNGFTETYRNNRGDTIWSAPENEIGEALNMRQWIIRAW
ncbi:MAG: hypothetical protein OXU96_01125 [Gammaproteobacteria bacterium]|nr:hypothetical protein [Gammaproteobacteria bacterium]MDD9874851.1 hypothetical protein [Gammaproteobacteria bacterium]